MEELDRAIAFDRRVSAGGALETIAIPGGQVRLHPGLPTVHVLNAVALDAPLPPQFDASALATLADRWLGHLGHRYVCADDGQAAEQLVGELTSSGWHLDRTLYMVLRDQPHTRAEDPRARRVSEAELDALTLAVLAHYDYMPATSAELPALLTRAQALMRAGTTAWGFAAGYGGGLQSMCTLFLDPDLDGVRIAMVENVGTLPQYRERGLAKAAVSAAVAAAEDWGAELITVPADADDWPQLLYHRLGFEPVGTQLNFTRREAAATSAT
jgi:GNAT superfamily N-acetyltransferase